MHSIHFVLLACQTALGLTSSLPIPHWHRLDSPEKIGTATYYLQEGAAGACGFEHQDSDFIVALHPAIYAEGIHCGKSISISHTQINFSHVGMIADMCPGCRSPGSIDLSTALFDKFAPRDNGTFPVSWEFAD